MSKLPYLGTKVNCDIYFEQLIKKLVIHMQSQLTVFANEKRLDYTGTRATAWFIRAFRLSIEDAWGMNIYERDDGGGEEQDIAAALISSAFNTCGVTLLCIEMQAPGIDGDVQLEATKLLVAMLFKEGGALYIQESIYELLSTTHSHLFFRQLRAHIQDLIAWHKWNDVIILEEGQEPR